MDMLGLESITLVVPGDADYPLADRVRVLGLSRIPAVGLEPSALSRRP
jgi:hypothetical protein